jgi:hypothetical protein
MNCTKCGLPITPEHEEHGNTGYHIICPSREGSRSDVRISDGLGGSASDRQPGAVAVPLGVRKSDPAAEGELQRRVEWAEPVFEAFVAEVAAKKWSNALNHIEPLIRELKLCEHDCRYLVEERRRLALASATASERLTPNEKVQR